MSGIIKIKENYEFKRAYNKADSLVSPYVVIYYRKNRYGNLRLGITAGKKIGCAVARNRAKRVITAAFRGCLPEICTGYDFIIVARTRILSVKSNVVKNSILNLLKKAGVCKNSYDTEFTD